MNILSWLPSAELLGSAWNIYGVLCLIAVFIAGVRLTKHTKKPLLYRIIFSMLVAWCVQLIFVETASLVITGVLFSMVGKFSITSLSWVLYIGPIPFEVRPMYVILPFAFLGYFALSDKKAVGAEKMFDWKPKWMLVLLVVMIVCDVLCVALGYTLPQTSYPPESVERYVVYYFNYVPVYTAYAILGIKSWNSKKYNVVCSK